MANKRYFLGSVGKAEAFRVNSNGELELAFVSKTLTDSGLNIQTTKDDIRAGQGAPIQFSFYHDSSVEITLTDVLWKPEYLTAQLGAEFNDVNGHVDYVSKTATFTNGVSENFNETVLELPLTCMDGDKYAVWGTKKGEDDWKKIAYDGPTHKLTLAGAEGEYCIRFLSNDARAKVAEISTQIIPEVLFLIITAPIFAGDSCAASKGKAAGHITFEIPKFQLNGAQEFSMNMSSNQTMSLSGIALASETTDCEAIGGKLLRVIEVIENRDWKDDIEDIMSDEEYEKVGQVPHIYGIKKDGTVTKLDNADLTFFNAGTSTSALNGEGKFAAAGAVDVTLQGTSPAITTSITVTSGQ